MSAPAPAAMLAPTETLPVLIDRASAALANARTSAEVLEARDMARVAYDAAKSASRIARARQAHDDVIERAWGLQADALEIEARAKMRLAEEYNAAQERGEVAKSGQRNDLVANGNEVKPTVAELGFRRDEIHDARNILAAETAHPGLIRQALDAMARPTPTPDNPRPRPVEPTRAELQRSVLAAVADARRQPDRRNPNRVADPFRDTVLSFIDHCEQLAEMGDLEKIAAYRDPQFPTTSQRLDRFSAAALRVLTRFMEMRNA